MLKIVNYSEYLKNKLCIKSIFSWLNGRAVEQLNSSISVKLFNLSTIKLKNLFTIYDSQLTKKVFAFTLAETLIVMGVIGVVAALTLPNLNQSTNNKEKVAKVKKIYSNLNDALGRAQAVYGPVEEWCSNYHTGSCYNRHLERLTEFMKTSKVCNSVSVCSVTLNAGSGGYSYSKSAVLADGALIAISFIAPHNQLLVDIDGTAKGKNKAGSDIFKFYYNSTNGVYVSSVNDNSFVPYYSSNNYNIADYAASWVINFDNMDYLKTTDGTTCPNGTKLTFGGNHSCN